MSKYFIVNNKPDDWGNCRRELVQTSPALANEYYYSQEVPVAAANTLKEYMKFVDEGDEKKRTEAERFYGGY